MAITAITPTKLTYNTVAAMPTSALVGADGAEIDFTGVDGKILIAVDTADAVIKAGNGIQGVKDLAVASGKCVTIESGMYKNVSGARKNKVYVTGATAKVLAIQLP